MMEKKTIKDFVVGSKWFIKPGGETLVVLAENAYYSLYKVKWQDGFMQTWPENLILEWIEKNWVVYYETEKELLQLRMKYEH
jgi:hypothetical protein